MMVYHVTTESAADSILRVGFIGTVGVSNRPIHEVGLHRGTVVLEMDIPESVFDVYTYFPRWFLNMARIPATVLNRYRCRIADFTVPWVVQQLRKMGYTDEQIRMGGFL